MADAQDMTPREAYRAVVDGSGMSRNALSRALGRSENYLHSSLAQGGTPRLDLFAEVAGLAGYELYVVRGDERIRIVPDESRPQGQ